MRYKMVTWHGEGSTVYYIVDTAAPAEDQPAVVCSYRDKAEAEEAQRCFSYYAGVVIY